MLKFNFSLTLPFSNRVDYTDILIEVRKIVRALNLESKRIQKEFGISIPQLLCLNYLRYCKDFQTTHKELTRFLHLNSSTVTGIINRLEKKGFIARLPKREDKRVTYVTLTSSGSKLLEQAPDLLHERLAKSLSDLPEAKVDNIRDSLKLLTAALGIEKVDASPLFTIQDPISSEE